MRKTLTRTAGIAILALGVTGQAMGAPCLTNPSAQVGNPIFGATVQTFINLGINPNPESVVARTDGRAVRESCITYE
jgi:hypothetical protein